MSDTLLSDEQGGIVPDPSLVTSVTFGVVREGPTRRVVAGSVRLHPKLDLATLDIESKPGAPFTPMPLWRDGEFMLSKGQRIHIFGFGFSDANNTVSPGRALRGVVEYDVFHAEIPYAGDVIFRSVLEFTARSTLQGARPGDSGGPALGWQNGVWKQMGVLSAGAEKGTPAERSITMIADVRPSTEWIFSGADMAGSGGGAPNR